jgi:fatty-acyl-CoA synthase
VPSSRASAREATFGIRSRIASVNGFPHERWGEAAHAFVVLKQGARTDEIELRAFARANLAHFKAAHSVTFVNELPKTATGKIQKYILRAQRPAIAPQ